MRSMKKAREAIDINRLPAAELYTDVNDAGETQGHLSQGTWSHSLTKGKGEGSRLRVSRETVERWKATENFYEKVLKWNILTLPLSQPHVDAIKLHSEIVTVLYREMAELLTSPFASSQIRPRRCNEYLILLDLYLKFLASLWPEF